ncbi:hypothetical protein ACFL4Z_04130, partial [candidate division KSB1 bacterium]
TGGLVFTKALSDKKYIINFGGNVNNINFNNSYKIFKSKNFKIFNNLRYTSENSVYVSGISSEYAQYPNLKSQNSVETDVFIRWQKNYETKTTLGTKVLYGYNHYFNKSTFVGDKLVFENKSEFADRISLEILIAQSITDLLGASLKIEYSTPLNCPERYVAINSDYVLFEEEIFNDPFDYNLYDISVQLKKIFRNNITAQIIGLIQNRGYVNQKAMDINGSFIYPDILRQDIRKLINFNTNKNFNLSKFAVKSLMVGFSLLWLDSESNDPYYNYGNVLTSLNFSFSLF